MEAVISSADKASSLLPVWITVVDPETDDGRGAIGEWDHGRSYEWAVPADAQSGDLVLGWLTGGTGFRYLLRIMDPPRAALPDEHGPQQARLIIVEPIQPSIPMSRLKGDPGLRRWWPIKFSMQGVVRAQRRNITRDREWPSFVRMVGTVAPKAAARLRRDAAAKAGPLQADNLFEIVSFLDQGATDAVQITVTRALANVLARASSINAKRDGYDVSFSSLLLAVRYGDDAYGKWLTQYIEQQGVRIDHALSKVGKNAADAAAAAARGVQDRESILSSPLQRTVSARQALEEAARIAQAQSDEMLDTCHLLAAMIGLTDYHETDFGAMSLDRPRWGASFLQCVASQTSDTAEIGFWQRYYTRRFPGHELPPLKPRASQGHRPDYDADAYTSTDLLTIDDEVAALASVIASKQTKLPLAIGLFGDWGSGKTFFMKHLRRRIEQLGIGARAQKVAEREFYANIAQIEFNAWHYQEGNLWASLVDHLLRNLRFGENEEEAQLKERRNEIVRDLDDNETRQKAAAEQSVVVDQKVREAEQRVKMLKQDEDDARAALAKEMSGRQVLDAIRLGLMDPAVRRDAEEVATELGIPTAQRSAAELREALTDASREMQGIGALLVPMLRGHDGRKRAAYLVLALAGPPLAAVVLYSLLIQPDLLEKVATYVTTAGTLITGVTVWMNKQLAWVKATRQRLDPVVQQVNLAVDNAIEAAVREQKNAVVDKLRDLETLRQQQAAAKKERDELATHSTALKTRLAVLDDDDLILRFLDDRIGGGDYQQKLGIAALVRRDFERISHRIQKMTERELSGKVDQKLVINRIVLYIDDLDRCEMDKVVPVLRAVHLLLAFPAFVVVVGVDSRWVARCLQEHLSTVFGGGTDDDGRRVTPLDYLEKIFQIPIWLEPVLPDQRVSMARHLLRKPIAPAANPPDRQPETPPAEAAAPETESNARRPADEQPHGAHEEDADGDATTANRDAAPPPESEPVQEPAVDLNPAGLTISDGEYAFLGDLGTLLSSSPRVIKRFVNTYRLINVTLAQAGVRDPDRQPHDSHIRLLLLAILVDMPELSEALQDAMRDGNDFNLAITPLIEVLDARYRPEQMTPERERELEQWRAVRQWMEDRGEPWTTVTAARFSEWLTPVGRYTFNLSRSKAGAAAPRSPSTSAV